MSCDFVWVVGEMMWVSLSGLINYVIRHVAISGNSHASRSSFLPP
jgi:hypothetical protein